MDKQNVPSLVHVWIHRQTAEDINTIVTPTAPTVTYNGPITRARARQLNYQVHHFLVMILMFIRI